MGKVSEWLKLLGKRDGKPMTGKTKARLIAAVVAAAAVIAIYAGMAAPRVSVTGGSADMEAKLADALTNIAGAGQVKVVIYYASTPELVPVLGSDVTSGVVRSGQDVLIAKENQPEITGVLVVAQGAGDINVRLSLLRAVTTLMGVDAARVEVMGM